MSSHLDAATSATYTAARIASEIQVTDQGCDILTAREGETSMAWDVAAVQR